ncbi:MAG: hypothetical protein ACK5MJ_07070 [Alphaproteobacteria bacterium]
MSILGWLLNNQITTNIGVSLVFLPVLLIVSSIFSLKLPETAKK